MTEEEKQKRLTEIEDRAVQIKFEASLSHLVRALAVGFQGRSSQSGSSGIPAADVTGLLAVTSATGDVKSFMKELLALQTEKNGLINQTTDATSVVVTVPKVVIPAVTGNDSRKITVPNTVIRASELLGTDTITIPEVKVSVNAGVITIPEVVINGDPGGGGGGEGGGGGGEGGGGGGEGGGGVPHGEHAV
jgi:hypothetical protein